MPRYTGPLLTRPLLDRLRTALASGETRVEESFDLGRSRSEATLSPTAWRWSGDDFPWPGELRERAIYYWTGEDFAPLQRYAGSLIKLVPTDWGTPTFEIDGIKMLVTARISPWADARQKVALVKPAGKTVLDTCGGLGYFAAACLAAGAARVQSFEKNPDVLWLRQHNPWSPDPDSADAGGRLDLRQGDISQIVGTLPDRGVDAILHDPPRFGIAGELYSQAFYDQLFRVLRPQGSMFHYTGAPNARTSGRDVPGEVARRLTKAGFRTERALDGVFAVKSGASARR
jgi:uncharacterized protein